MTPILPLSIVIPAYNEEARLAPTLLDALAAFRRRRLGFEILVVDDGSRDATSQLVRDLSWDHPEVRLIRLAANRGKGYAVRTGVLNARGQLVLFADADGATPWEEFDRLHAAVVGGADIAIGSRAKPSVDTAVSARAYRRLMGRAFAWLVQALTVKDISDTQCGFKLFRGALAQELFSRMRMNGFSFDVEVLLMGQRRGSRIAEVPVNWTHRPGSRVSLVRDSLLMARDLFIIRHFDLRGDYDRPHVAELPPTQTVLEGPSLSNHPA